LLLSSGLAIGILTVSSSAAQTKPGVDAGPRALVAQRIAQAVGAKNIPAALNAYDDHVALTKLDDLGLLDPIARAVLAAIGSAGDHELARDAALERLAAAGDKEARRSLEAAATGGRALMPAAISADISLARIGDQKALARLGERLLSPQLREKAELADGLTAAGDAKSAYIFIALLKDPDPGARAVAARALATIGSREAIAPLRQAFATEDGPGRMPFAAALKSLGSEAADDMIARMAKSPAADVRMLAAEAYAAAKVPGWADLVRPFLKDSNTATRLRAAELLIEVEPNARALVAQGALDPNPADREEAARILERKPPYQVSLLRRLLEDRDSFVRVFAAGAIVKAARAKP
jgi:HEAT repeat protein